MGCTLCVCAGASDITDSWLILEETRLCHVTAFIVGKAFNNCIHNLFKEKQIEVSDFSVCKSF